MKNKDHEVKKKIVQSEVTVLYFANIFFLHSGVKMPFLLGYCGTVDRC